MERGYFYIGTLSLYNTPSKVYLLQSRGEDVEIERAHLKGGLSLY
jgi:hypothetical protein